MRLDTPRSFTQRHALDRAWRFFIGVVKPPSKHQSIHLYTLFTPVAVLFASRLHAIN
jgi:hypothetical protein